MVFLDHQTYEILPPLFQCEEASYASLMGKDGLGYIRGLSDINQLLGIVRRLLHRYVTILLLVLLQETVK